eukprot:COSAG04_NODE_2927_length_3379_cov_9.868782_5_plen_325_part_00
MPRGGRFSFCLRCSSPTRSCRVILFRVGGWRALFGVAAAPAPWRGPVAPGGRPQKSLTRNFLDDSLLPVLPHGVLTSRCRVMGRGPPVPTHMMGRWWSRAHWPFTPRGHLYVMWRLVTVQVISAHSLNAATTHTKEMVGMNCLEAPASAHMGRAAARPVILANIARHARAVQPCFALDAAKYQIAGLAATAVTLIIVPEAVVASTSTHTEATLTCTSGFRIATPVTQVGTRSAYNVRKMCTQGRPKQPESLACFLIECDEACVCFCFSIPSQRCVGMSDFRPAISTARTRRPGAAAARTASPPRWPAASPAARRSPHPHAAGTP